MQKLPIIPRANCSYFNGKNKGVLLHTLALLSVLVVTTSGFRNSSVNRLSVPHGCAFHSLLITLGDIQRKYLIPQLICNSAYHECKLPGFLSDVFRCARLVPMSSKDILHRYSRGGLGLRTKRKESNQWSANQTRRVSSTVLYLELRSK